MKKLKDYADIIDLPRPEMKHKRQPPEARAAQFAPYAALVGFYDKVAETNREKLEELAEAERFEVDIDAQEFDEEK